MVASDSCTTALCEFVLQALNFSAYATPIVALVAIVSLFLGRFRAGIYVSACLLLVAGTLDLLGYLLQMRHFHLWPLGTNVDAALIFRAAAPLLAILLVLSGDPRGKAARSAA